MSQWVCGVDGCRSGWFYIALRGDDYRFGVVPKLAQLVAVESPRCVLLDIPMGLPTRDAMPRSCDRFARQVLGPRRSSVFSAPIREVLEVADYHQANTLCKTLTGRGLSRQTFNIMPKIAEVDGLLRACPAAQRTLREAHPELCFWGLAGSEPMTHNKKTQAGFDERLGIVAGHWPTAREAVAESLARYTRSEVVRDDVLDALALALTAAQPSAQLKTLPARPEHDSRGLPMEMVYWQKPVGASSAAGLPAP